ncbi:MAG: Malonyl-(acyl-carrier protein) O-methyltransferase [Firmicutes bacterium ADurb.Bin419]|nr:MAG: Malonyl-(acyl-carrier protein) O-methyltransferase [Firmicutes bacterium ADurb.Bin419]
MSKRDWDVWQSKDVVDEILPALGKPEGVWGGTRPDWLPKYKSVLDAGCGPGVFYPILTENGESYTGIDSSQHMIDIALSTYQGVDFRVADILNLPFKNGEYEFVFNNAVLIHMPTDVGFMAAKELVRVARKYATFNMYTLKETDMVQYLGDIGILQVYGFERRDALLEYIKETSDAKVSFELVEDTPVIVNNVECRTERWMFKKTGRATSTKDAL